MREAIGGTWLFNIVIFFVILFTGYMSLSLNHTKAFNVKDDVIKIIEREGGFDDIHNVNSEHDKKMVSSIADILKKNSYRTANDCPDEAGGSVWYGFDREGKRTDGNAAFCVREISVADDTDIGLPKTVYYQVVVFYQLDLPIFNSLFRFDLKGDTMLVYI